MREVEETAGRTLLFAIEKTVRKISSSTEVGLIRVCRERERERNTIIRYLNR